MAPADFRARIARLQAAMRRSGLQAVVLEPGPAMQALTGVRWGRSERTFAVVLTQEGDPIYVLPAFEEMRARELITVGKDILLWQEDESPYERIAQAMKERGITAGRVGVEETVRFFVFDGVRKAAPPMEYVSAQPVMSN